MVTVNTSLIVDQSGTFHVQNHTTLHQPQPNEILIETVYSGINPADIKHSQHLGILDTVLGYDFCGKVIATTAGSPFEEGDLVAGYTPTGIGRPARYGTHQSVLACPFEYAFKVPPNLPPLHAACLTVVCMTAADALFNILHLAMPGDTHQAGDDDDSAGGDQTAILIWGASSSVGICAIQLTKWAGVKNIFVTASPSRHALLKRLGATQCFDYNNPNVAEDISKTLLREAGPGANRMAIDAVGTMGPSNSAELMRKCVAPDAELLSVAQRPPPFSMPFATKDRAITLHPSGFPHPITLPPTPEEHKHAREVLLRVVEDYGTWFQLPHVEEIVGDANHALKEVQRIAAGGQTFGKFAVKHPFQG